MSLPVTDRATEQDAKDRIPKRRRIQNHGNLGTLGLTLVGFAILGLYSTLFVAPHDSKPPEKRPTRVHKVASNVGQQSESLKEAPNGATVYTMAQLEPQIRAGVLCWASGNRLNYTRLNAHLRPVQGGWVTARGKE